MATPEQLGKSDVGGARGAMSHHLRYAHLPEPELEALFLDILQQADFMRQALDRAQALDFPKWRIVSGALYNTVWNHLTGRPAAHGIKDIDLFYFDDDTSWEAEDKVIQSATGFPAEPPVEVRNQARVHLWYELHFGRAIPPLTSVEEAIDRFASKTHCVGLSVENGVFDLYAPYGLKDIFAMRVLPNPLQDNKATHEAKAARQLGHWPELEIIPWPKESNSTY